MKRHQALYGLVVLLCAAAVAPAWAQRPCADFRWDVQRERSLFAEQGQALKAGTDAAATPTIRVDRLYDLQLTPQPKVQFVAAPGKVQLADGAYAGLVKFRVPQRGSYRVSLDAPFWIDVVSQGKMLATQDFQGQHGCANPRKIVEFLMPADQELWLQFSGATTPQVHVTITPTPAAKAP